MLSARSLKFWLTALAAAVFGIGVFGRAFGATTAVTVSQPTSNQVVVGTTVASKFAVAGLKLVDPQTNIRNVYGQGHLHIWLDQDNPTKTSAIKSASPVYTFQNVKYGNHKLLVELVNNDHSSFNPKVTAAVTFQTAASVSEKSNQVLVISAAAFLFICLALYFVYPKTSTRAQTKNTSPKKSSRN